MSDIAVETTSVYLIPGMKVRIFVIQDPESGRGDFARMESFAVSSTRTVDLAITNGFYVENENVGTIAPVANMAAVDYTHKRPEPNTIWFIAHSGAGSRRGAVNVVSVPVHDHSSIVQGGPAYGTYFSDDDVE